MMVKRRDLLTRWNTLKQERSSWIDHWRDISENLLPRNGRFLTTTVNDGKKKHNQIIDSTGIRAHRVLSAGMMAGMTSPARPWFRLTTSIPELDETPSVKKWLAEVTRLQQMVFAKSNTYRALHHIYDELGAFGSSASFMMPHFKSVMWQFPLTIGEYCFSTDQYGLVDTLYREQEMSVRQMVQAFGLDKVSISVKNLYDTGSLEKRFTVIHAMEPRTDRDVTKRDAKNMAYSSIWFELGASDDKVLRESGFKRFRAVCPRWAESGGDMYGNSPGMEALGDIRQLQRQQMDKGKAIAYKADPPLQIPTALRGNERDTLPGGVSYYDATQPNSGIRSAFDVNLDLNHLLADIQDVRQRINSTFYADLFLMLANSTNPQMTATEVAERHEEKLLMLGPVLERLHNELLNPLIESSFEMMVEANIIPSPPEEIQGMELNVEFVSMLAQAQRAVGTNSIDRFVIGLGQVAAIKPEVLDKLDADKWADVYSDILGVDPELIVSGDKVALIREQRAKQAQAANQAAMMQQGAATAKDLSAADTEGKNALTDVTRMFSGYTT